MKVTAHRVKHDVIVKIVMTGEHEVKDEEGRRFNLATRVMSNGVEVIVAGPTPALRWENSQPQPTLTLSEAVVMMLPEDKPNEFVTKTCTTTFTYLNTIAKDGTTTVLTEEQVRSYHVSSRWSTHFMDDVINICSNIFFEMICTSNNGHKYMQETRTLNTSMETILIPTP